MKTLYVRIVVITVLVMLLSGVLAFILANGYYQNSLKPYNDKKVTKIAQQMAQYVDAHKELEPSSYFEHMAQTGYQLYVVDGQGNGRFYGGAFREKELASHIVTSVKNGTVYHGIAAFPSTPFITGFFDNDLQNSIGVPVTVKKERYAVFLRPNIEMQFGEMRIFFSVILLLTILLSIVLVAISGRFLVKPLLKLTAATKKVATGDYHITLQENRRDELGTLARSFASMARSLQQLEDMRQTFVSNVSHEIQSPLSSIKGFAETLQSDNLTADQRHHYLAIIQKESARLSQLSKQLLLLASLEKEENVIEKTTFDLGAQLQEVLMMTEWSWQEKELAIEVEVPSLYMYGDHKLLHQVWQNLLLNSIRHTPVGGTISVSVSATASTVHVVIADTGVGIAARDLTHIFERFYKADRARDRSDGSSGLGLSIVKKIIDLHDGSIAVTSERGIGTTVSIQLPKM
ncbi:two-component sensor histidine kinase [Fictibacillus macauensis ZFHKF-1]|uniref:Heme sensor protein HssS n=1 Tax=Fictibacillus macauensis ZFHKF-1 TaxID=1196324 RepID=I8IZE2_9BACL|nr:HAMP domain-containing sensor histidine kinase [Fictibacillus macauensis]EIT84866.1 two-component sensor histidine kinase [Fictibacillus macauensis ZFHKF-1]